MPKSLDSDSPAHPGGASVYEGGANVYGFIGGWEGYGGGIQDPALMAGADHACALKHSLSSTSGGWPCVSLEAFDWLVV